RRRTSRSLSWTRRTEGADFGAEKADAPRNAQFAFCAPAARLNSAANVRIWGLLQSAIPTKCCTISPDGAMKNVSGYPVVPYRLPIAPSGARATGRAPHPLPLRHG